MLRLLHPVLICVLKKNTEIDKKTYMQNKDDNKTPGGDLFNNPMTNAARSAMTPEQLEEYKKIGEYMYNTVDYKNSTVLQTLPPNDANLAKYAAEALKAGGDPYDLSEQEVQALIHTYGETWYRTFGLKKHEVPVPFFQVVSGLSKKQKKK